jgi:hypothetical protein
MPQAQILNSVGIKAVAMTTETVGKDRTLWKQVANCGFQVVYASPEILLAPTSYFFKNMCQSKKTAFHSRLIGTAIDECHSVDDWGEFRPLYSMVGSLREALCHVPFIGFSATLSPLGITRFTKTTNLRSPVLVKESIRRYNLTIWVVRRLKKGFEDLDILISDDISSASDIPATLVFVDSLTKPARIAKYLRKQLPEHLRSAGRDIIRVYTSPLSEIAKEEAAEGLANQATRIAICTDAFGMGVHLRDISRVVQFGLNSRIGIGPLYQRFGRGGRDFSKTALAMIFVSNSNLSKKAAGPVKPESDQSDIVLPSDYSLPVTEENMPAIKEFLSELYSGPKKGALPQEAEAKLAPGIRLTIKTTGCRHRAILTSFNDPIIFYINPDPDCDNCHVQRLIETDNLGNPPTVHGIPLAITVAYEPYLPTMAETQAPKPRNAPLGEPINSERLEILTLDIRTWLSDVTAKMKAKRPYLSASMIFSEKAITTIRSKVRHIKNADDLRNILHTCGYRFPLSPLNAYVESLFACIEQSLQASEHLQPQKQLVKKPKMAAPMPKSNPRSSCVPIIPVPKASSLPQWPIPATRPEALLPRPALATVEGTGNCIKVTHHEGPEIELLPFFRQSEVNQSSVVHVCATLNDIEQPPPVKISSTPQHVESAGITPNEVQLAKRPVRKREKPLRYREE